MSASGSLFTLLSFFDARFPCFFHILENESGLYDIISRLRLLERIERVNRSFTEYSRTSLENLESTLFFFFFFFFEKKEITLLLFFSLSTISFGH